MGDPREAEVLCALPRPPLRRRFLGQEVQGKGEQLLPSLAETGREQRVLGQVAASLPGQFISWSVRPDLETGRPRGEDKEEGQCAHEKQQLIEGLVEGRHLPRSWGSPPGPPTEGVWELGLHHQHAQEDGADPWPREQRWLMVR